MDDDGLPRPDGVEVAGVDRHLDPHRREVGDGEDLLHPGDVLADGDLAVDDLAAEGGADGVARERGRQRGAHLPLRRDALGLHAERGEFARRHAERAECLLGRLLLQLGLFEVVPHLLVVLPRRDASLVEPPLPLVGRLCQLHPVQALDVGRLRLPELPALDDRQRSPGADARPEPGGDRYDGAGDAGRHAGHAVGVELDLAGEIQHRADRRRTGLFHHHAVGLGDFERHLDAALHALVGPADRLAAPRPPHDDVERVRLVDDAVAREVRAARAEAERVHGSAQPVELGDDVEVSGIGGLAVHERVESQLGRDAGLVDGDFEGAVTLGFEEAAAVGAVFALLGVLAAVAVLVLRRDRSRGEEQEEREDEAHACDSARDDDLVLGHG